MRPVAFRVAIGSLDIFLVRQKGGIQLPLFFVSIAVGVLAHTAIPSRASEIRRTP
jgi:hypothetical protein